MREKQKERLGTDTEKKKRGLRPIVLQVAIKKSPKLR